jgi:hypothetical protein
MAYESDPITQKLNDLVCSKELYFDLISLPSMSLPEQALIGTWEFANEVYNGGFPQYFQNAPVNAKAMIDVLRSINASGAADILESATRLAGPGTPWGDAGNLNDAVKSMPADVRERLTELEDKLYSELDNLHRQVFGYLSKHRDKIDAPSDFWTEPTIQ